MELHQYLFQTNFILLFFTVIAPPNPSSNYHDVFLKLSFVSVSLSASMLCLAGCTVGKMNRHTHSTSVSLLVHCPRWQCWAPSLVWFPLQSQSALARPYSWFTSFAFPSFSNIISVSHLFISLPAEMLSQMGRFSNKQVAVLILRHDTMASTLAHAKCIQVWYCVEEIFIFLLFSLWCIIYIYTPSRLVSLTYCGLYQSLYTIWRHWNCVHLTLVEIFI